MIDVVELKYQVGEVERQKYVCARGSAVETAPGPVRAIDGGRYPLRFAIKVAFDKYVAHLPLERQARLMAHHVLNVTLQTHWEQCPTVTELLAPICDALCALLQASPIVGVDHTGWPDLEDPALSPLPPRGRRCLGGPIMLAWIQELYSRRRDHVQLVESAKAASVDPIAYLFEVATRAKRNPGAVLLPAEFRLRRSASLQELWGRVRTGYGGDTALMLPAKMFLGFDH